MPRILSRLRSRHAKSSRKTAGKPAVISQLGQIFRDGSVTLRPRFPQQNLSAMRGRAQALEVLFARLEGIPDKSTNAAEIQEVLEEIIRKAHDFTASDLVIALRDFRGNPSLKNHLPNAVGKLGRYFSVSSELVCAARDRTCGIFHNIQVEPNKIKVPAPIRDAGYRCMLRSSCSSFTSLIRISRDHGLSARASVPAICAISSFAFMTASKSHEYMAGSTTSGPCRIG